MRRTFVRSLGLIALFALIGLSALPSTRLVAAAQDAGSPVAVEPSSTIVPSSGATAPDPAPPTQTTATDIPVLPAAEIFAGINLTTCTFQATGWTFQILNINSAAANPGSITVTFADGSVTVPAGSTISPPGGVYITPYSLSGNTARTLVGASAMGVEGATYNFVLRSGPACQANATSPTATPITPSSTPSKTPTKTPVPPSFTPSNTPNTPTNTSVHPSLTPSNTPTNTPVPPSFTPSSTRTNTPSPIPSNTSTNTPTTTLTPTATATATATLTATATASNTATATKTSTATTPVTPSSTATVTPSNTATASQTASATATSTLVPTVVTTANVNCRTGASTSAPSLGVIPRNSTLSLRGAPSGSWTPVLCFGQNGWISSAYLGSGPTATATPAAQPTAVTTTRVNCRATPTTSATNVITVLNSGVTVPVRGAAVNGWTPVVCGGQNGWISSKYLRSNS